MCDSCDSCLDYQCYRPVCYNYIPLEADPAVTSRKLLLMMFSLMRDVMCQNDPYCTLYVNVNTRSEEEDVSQ